MKTLFLAPATCRRWAMSQVLGSAVGMKVVEDVPYITGLDRFLGAGLSPDTCDYLKDMGRPAPQTVRSAFIMWKTLPRRLWRKDVTCW